MYTIYPVPWSCCRVYGLSFLNHRFRSTEDPLGPSVVSPKPTDGTQYTIYVRLVSRPEIGMQITSGRGCAASAGTSHTSPSNPRTHADRRIVAPLAKIGHGSESRTVVVQAQHRAPGGITKRNERSAHVSCARKESGQKYHLQLVVVSIPL